MPTVLACPDWRLQGLRVETRINLRDVIQHGLGLVMAVKVWSGLGVCLFVRAERSVGNQLENLAELDEDAFDQDEVFRLEVGPGCDEPFNRRKPLLHLLHTVGVGRPI
jgi:hypothetical protein